MNKVLLLIPLILLTLGSVYYFQSTALPDNKVNHKNINNRNFFKKVVYDFKQSDSNKLTLTQSDDSEQKDGEVVPEILTYGIDMTLNVGNQSQKSDNKAIDQNIRLTAQCDVQTIYDQKRNIFDIAVSFTMIDKHDLDGETQQQKLQQSQEDSNEEVDEDVVDYGLEYQGTENIEQYQNQFIKFMVDADSGEILRMFAEKFLEEDQIISFAAQSLVADIIPELRQESYESGVLQDENLGTLKARFEESPIDEDNTVIKKSYNEKDIVQEDVPFLNKKINYERNVVLENESGIVNEGTTEYDFEIGDKIKKDNLQESFVDGEQQDLEISVMGQFEGKMNSKFWKIDPTYEDSRIAREILRYRKYFYLFEEKRLFAEQEAEIQYGNGEAEEFELTDIDEDIEVQEKEVEDFINSTRPSVYYEEEEKQKLRAETFEDFHAKNIVETIMTEEQLELARQEAERRLAERAQKAVQDNLSNEDQQRLQRAYEVLTMFQDLDAQKKAMEEKVKGLVYQQLQIDQQIKKLEQAQNKANELKQKLQEKVKIDNLLTEADRQRIQQVQQTVQQMEALKTEIQNFPQNLKNELNQIKNQAQGAARNLIQQEINRLANADLDKYQTTEAEIFREVKQLAKVKVLGKEVGVDFVYSGYTKESRVQAKLRIGSQYIATFLSKNFKNCSSKENSTMHTKDFTVFQATFPVLGIIVIPVHVGARIQYGFDAGVTTGPRLCQFSFGPKFVAGVFGQGSISLAGIISAGVYSQGNFLDTALQFSLKTEQGKTVASLDGRFSAYSVEVGVSYNLFKCSLSNLKTAQPEEKPVLRGFGKKFKKITKNVTRPVTKPVEKVVKTTTNTTVNVVTETGKTVGKVVRETTKVPNQVMSVAKRTGAVIQKGANFLVKIVKICQRHKGTKRIAKYQGKQSTKTLFYKTINFGI